MTTPEEVHPFQQSGLGRAPFRFIGMQARFDAQTGQPLGSCAHCGTGIKYCCAIRSHDGREFQVGTTCVLKLGMADNKLVSDVKAAQLEMEREARWEKREAARARRWAKACAVRDATRARLAELPELWRDQPHPHLGLADKGLTLRDWAEWMMAGHAGMAGWTTVAKRLATAEGGNG